jgi:hypothetical protein
MPDLGVLKNVMAHNWVEPSKRERKRVLNYSEADYYKQVCVVCVGVGVGVGVCGEGRGAQRYVPFLCCVYLCLCYVAPSHPHVRCGGPIGSETGAVVTATRLLAAYPQVPTHMHVHALTCTCINQLPPPPLSSPLPPSLSSGAQDEQG